MMHMGLFIDSEKEMHFPSCNFCLKKRLDNPAQFKTSLLFGRAHQPIRTNPRLSFTHKELGSCESLIALRQCFFRPEMAMFGQGNAMGLE
jgi:hypothetical protein